MNILNAYYCTNMFNVCVRQYPYNIHLNKNYIYTLFRVPFQCVTLFLQRIAPAGICSGRREVHQGRACKGSPHGGSWGRGPPDAGEVFKNFVKTSMKNLQFLKKFSRKSRAFVKIFLKFYRIFGKILERNLDMNF